MAAWVPKIVLHSVQILMAEMVPKIVLHT